MKLKGVLVLVLAMVLAMGAITGCGGNNDDDQDLPGDEDIITIAGSEFTVAELKEMEAVTEEIVRTDDGETEQYPIKGVALDVVLESLDINAADLETIRLIAGDGYAVEVPNEILTQRTVILAYEIDGEPLREDTRPIRVFIPEEEAMYWVRNTVEISVSEKDSQPGAALQKLVFFETLLANLDVVEYEEGGQAVTTADLFAGAQAGENVSMLAADGFEKNEEHATFIEAYIVFEGDDNAPAFRGPDLPRGMHVKDLVSIASGDSGFLFVEKGMEYFTAAEVEGNAGISLADLAEQFGLEADVYILEAVDGYTVEISGEDLSLGIVYINDDGQVTSRFDGLPKNTAVKDLLSLQAAD